MTSLWPGPVRWGKVIRLSLPIGLLVAAPQLLPSVFFLLPRRLQDIWFELCFVTLGLVLLGFRYVFLSRDWSDPNALLARRGFVRLDDASGWMLRRGLALGLGMLAAAMLLSWVPHYLVWPWCRDEDAFAVIAQSWEAGIRPYRDIRGYNFPGHIYLHWLIGKLAGWGRPRVFYGLDAALLIGFVFAVAAWSRRRLGGVVPGLAAAFAFLGFYLNLDYEQVGERDWHASLAAAAALMALEAWPGRTGLWVSAALQAMALILRPHAVLYVPAMLCSLGERPRPWRTIAEWAAAVGLLTALGFLPLAAHGILDDLVRGLRIAAYGGPYSRATPDRALEIVGEELKRPWILFQVASLALLGVLGGGLRRPARTWLIALTAALVYRILHPVQHRYLEIPLVLISSITFALPVSWIAGHTRISAPARVLVLAFLLVEAVPRVPIFCQPGESLWALPALLQGVEMEEPPPGGKIKWFKPNECPYPWEDYTATLEYLRRETTPDTEVANLLRQYPFPPLNGPVGRLSPFRAESGICWMWLIDQDLDEEFAKELERSPNSVVVWADGEIGKGYRLYLPKVTEVVRRRYRPEVRFGTIEIWRRLPEGSEPAVYRTGTVPAILTGVTVVAMDTRTTRPRGDRRLVLHEPIDRPRSQRIGWLA